MGESSFKVSGIRCFTLRGRVVELLLSEDVNNALVELDFCRKSVFELEKQVVGPVNVEMSH